MAELPIIAGASLQSAGEVLGAVSAAQTASFQSKIARRNAEIETQAAALQADRADREGRRRRGAAQAALAASGLDPSAGSPLDVLGEQAIADELNRRIAIQTGQARSREQRIAGIAARRRGEAAVVGGLLSAPLPFLKDQGGGRGTILGSVFS